MTRDEKRLRIRRTRQDIVIASVIGSAGLATGIGVPASAQAGADASQTGTVANQDAGSVWFLTLALVCTAASVSR